MYIAVPSPSKVFVKSRSPVSTPKRRRPVQKYSREDAGVIMGITADGAPIGIRENSIQNPPESDDELKTDLLLQTSLVFMNYEFNSV